MHYHVKVRRGPVHWLGFRQRVSWWNYLVTADKEKAESEAKTSKYNKVRIVECNQIRCKVDGHTQYRERVDEVMR